MPRPILPTIHSQNYDSEGASKPNIASLSSIPKEGDKQIASRKPYIASLEDDPVWMKCKSIVFHGAGCVQSKLGTVTGMDAFANRGQAWVSWAAHASEHADFLSEHGAPSRLHGEYNRWMGYVGNMLGVNSETQCNGGTQLTDQANDEIDYSRCRSSA